MSMVQLTIIQCLFAFFAYTGLTVALPAVVLYPKVAHCRAVTRFFVYFSAGNFYLMNLVYLLELLHISYWWTLVIGTVLPAFIMYVRFRNIALLARLKHSGERARRLARGSFGVKNWMHRSQKRLFASIAGGLRFAMRSVRIHMLDVVPAILVIVVVLGFYGPPLIQNFGYYASDVPVHNYWINYLGKNQIFVGGVYPFGFHNIIYYIHAVFGMDTYVLLRVFWLVQTLWIHLVLLMFLKGVCKSRFLPYAGVVIYVSGGFYLNTYVRYFASLPQEFGMLFILPAVYFAFEFFRIKKEELKGKREHPVSKWYLVGFAMNFAMTFSAHFYDTVILGVFCIGIACGYVWRFLQPKYFIKVVKTCMLGLGIALLPLVIAFATGTRLEGSLYWAMNVMTSEETDQAEKEYDENGIPIGAKIVELEDGTLAYEDVLEDGATVYYPFEDQEMPQEEKDSLIGKENGAIQEEETQQTEVNVPTPQERLRALGKRLKEVGKTIDGEVASCQFNDVSGQLRYLIYLSMLAMPVLVLLLFLLCRFDEAFSLISANVNVMLLIVLLAAPKLGLPAVMQQSRTCIYLDYSLPVLWVMTFDRVLYAVLGVWQKKWMHHLMNTASLAASVAACVLLAQMGLVKSGTVLDIFQSNEAITCLTNIIHDEQDFTWTIVSAFDEFRMGEDHGYHEELITFLKEMEYTGGSSMITIPTRTIYFFIEKRPLDYTEPYEGSGQLVSEAGASRMLPLDGGYSAYQGERRWILMSRFYEWAKQFQKLHPYEMTVYYENENFICYRLEQNDYHLFNLSIDYGYNMG